MNDLFFQKFLDKRKKINPTFKIHDFGRTANLKKTFSKGDTFNWSFKLCENTESVSDTKSS